MKRLLFIFISLLVLSGCGGQKVHESISDNMAADTKQVIGIFDANIEEDRSLTEKEAKIFEEYKLKYGAHDKNGDLTEEEGRLLILTRNMIDLYDSITTLSSDKGSYEDQKYLIEKVIEEGAIY